MRHCNQAEQLSRSCTPREVAKDSGLTFVADLQLARDPRREAIRPGCLDEDATAVRVAGFGMNDGPSMVESKIECQPSSS